MRWWCSDSSSFPTCAMPVATRIARGRYAAAIVDFKRSVNGAIAGGVAAGPWAAQQPADKRVFGSGYDDVELLGKLVTRGEAWPAAGAGPARGQRRGVRRHLRALRPFLPGPLVARAVTMAMVEHVALWPLGRLVDSLHPARKELTHAVRQPPRVRAGHVAPPAVRAGAGRARAAAQPRGRGRAPGGPGVLERTREHRGGGRRGEASRLRSARAGVSSRPCVTRAALCQLS